MTDRVARSPSSRCYSFLALLAFSCALFAGWIALRRPLGAISAGFFGIVGVFGIFVIVTIVFAALALRPVPEGVNTRGMNRERMNREHANLEHTAPQRGTPKHVTQEHDISPRAAARPKYPLLLAEDEAEIEHMFQRLKSVGRLDAMGDASPDPRASGES